VDAISGPTPPWGSPDQGWGWGDRPAITMTYHAAETFCLWLSHKTGKNYRLPTEAEWEFAARGGTTTPYFFEGSPKRFSSQTLRNRLFGADTTNINSYVIYAGNSMARTQSPQAVRPNPFGLKNMLGNVWEFCSDYYAEDAYASYPENMVVKNPTGPATGTERVIRGGSYRSDAYEVRAASRSHTRRNDWLRTDPQIPKSIWWYSDVTDVGFRVVMEWQPLEEEQ
jgi:formylglycine-generating enzyme